MISPLEAMTQIFRSLPPPQIERCETVKARGRRLAAPLVAESPLPLFDDSAMDGYALRLTELETLGQLPVSQEIPAGSAPTPLTVGSAARIFTGAALPVGADTVVIQEAMLREIGEAGQAIVRLAVDATQPKAGAHIRRRGGELSVGSTALSSGDLLDPASLGLAAGLGIASLPVYRRPQVSLLITGSELVPPFGRAPKLGERRESNGLLLESALQELGLTVDRVGALSDDDRTIEAALEHAQSADVIITVGGVSVGDYDRSGAVLRERAEPLFSKVAVKPGKPFTFARLGERLVFGLPGNPASAQVIFELFLRPALLAMMGDPRPHARVVSFPLHAPLAAGGRRFELRRAHLTENERGDQRLDLQRSQSS
ncbi:MAG: gephyrin-like molybdotransferase Glp, partial [Myxococcota bacterium]|nr:gephyrin-like molybdotransferase Glp [Myxococcota bacterium]